MKITQLMLSSGFGGAERYFIDLSHALQKRGYSVQIICHRDFSQKKLLASNRNLHIYSCPVFGWWDIYHGRRIQNAIQGFMPDVIHAHLARGAYISGKISHALHIPLVVKTHNYVNLKYYKDVDHFITTTNDQKKYLLERQIAESRISVIPNFSSISSNSPAKVRSSEIKFAAYGRLVEKKGMHILLMSFRQYLDAGRKASLHIGGDGPEKSALKKLCNDLNLENNVSFHGWVGDTAEFISRHDVMIIPSIDEPFGIAVLEIIARGKPLIVTRTRGPLEILNDDSALMVAPGNEGQLFRAMCSVTDNPDLTDSRTKNAGDIFINNYSEEKVLPEILRTYEKVIQDF